jgi:hypothetical protein
VVGSAPGQDQSIPKASKIIVLAEAWEESGKSLPVYYGSSSVAPRGG